VNGFIDALTNPAVPFVRYALIAGLLSSIPFGIIGSFVVVKRMTYIAGAISHTALGGIGLALYLSTVIGISVITPMNGAMIFALAASLIISLTITRTNARLDTVIGAIWAIGMSVGLIFIYITPGYADPMSYLFGNILLISKENLITITALNVVITTVSLMFYNQFVAVSFDSDFAKSRHINISLFETFLILLIALTVIVMMSLVGLVMVIALLTLPTAIATLFARRIKILMILSSAMCAFITTAGLVISYLLTTPTGSTTVVLAGGLYIVLLMVKRIIG